MPFCLPFPFHTSKAFLCIWTHLIIPVTKIYVGDTISSTQSWWVFSGCGSQANVPLNSIYWKLFNCVGERCTHARTLACTRTQPVRAVIACRELETKPSLPGLEGQCSFLVPRLSFPFSESLMLCLNSGRETPPPVLTRHAQGELFLLRGSCWVWTMSAGASRSAQWYL